ncbi:MAG: FtsQ-type POTRA domain-containing protein [Clostridia bacterium]|nr:FtsQ-type POTRA domain-containing protein [Clostridia bacterium]
MLDKEKNKPQNTATEKKQRSGFERLKRKNSTRQLRQRVLYTVLILVLLAVFLISTVAIFFRVHSITVKGNSVYNDGDIVNASGIKRDMNIYLIDDKSVSTAILSQFPYVRTVKVERKIPNSVVLNVTCDDPNYYVEIAGECFVLSGKLRVMSRFESKDEVLAAHPNIKKLIGGDISRAVVGSDLEYVRKSYSQQAKELLPILEAAELFEGVSAIDFSDRFNIYITYDHRLKANIGNTDDLQLKLRFMNEIVKDLGEAQGTIDIKDVEAAYVLLDSDGEYD